ncbi:MAG: TRAP transporter small permease [Oscillospiraceae bacterium]|nr:TRAP transporter small permease [Oscillospiraceae bacterium]
MKKYAKLILNNFELIFASLCVTATTLLVLMNVFLRYFMNTGIYWSEEVATMCFVWCIFVGSASAYKNGAHLGVDLLVKKLPKIPRAIVKIIVDILLVAINGYILYLAIVFVSTSYLKPTAVLAISSAWVSSSLIVGFGLTTIYAVCDLVRDVRKTLKGEEL